MHYCPNLLLVIMFLSSSKNEVLEGYLLKVVITSSCRKQIAVEKNIESVNLGALIAPLTYFV